MSAITPSGTSTWIIVVALVAVLALLFLLWRAGWSLRSLKKLKIGPVEGERFDQTAEKDQEVRSFGDVTVEVHESTFRGDVRDIIGVNLNAADRDEEHK